MWKTVQLGDICDISIGKTPSRRENRFWDKEKQTDNVWLSISDLTSVTGKYISDSKEHLSDEGAKMFKPVPQDTLVMSFKLSIGKLAFTQRELRTNEAIAALIIKDESLVSKEFLYYFLSSLDWEAIAGNDVKVKGKTLNKKKLNTLSIVLPPLAEQKRIVAKLDTAFAEIDRAVEFVQERFSRVEKALGQIVDIELSELREEYESCSLGEMLESVEYGTSTKCSKTGKYPVLRMGNMQTGSFVMDDLVYLDSDEELEKYRVRKDDVFFNRTNSALHVGKAAIYDGGSDCLFAGYLIRLNYSDDVLDGRFLNYYLNAPSTRAYGYSVMTSSVNQSNINGTKLKEYPFIKVDLKTQQCIRKKLDDLTALLSQVHFLLGKSLNEYAQLKSAILTQELQPPQNEAA